MQEEKAAEQKEREGDLVSAVHLYLKGGLPAKAAAVVSQMMTVISQDHATLISICPRSLTHR